ncbi:MAG: hypothetical protein SFU86_17505 [Pirellulaceae bacterium]|nr:hypothetical protein [Pirellulaceae bacterium]
MPRKTWACSGLWSSCIVAFLVAGSVAHRAQAAPPWAALIPFKSAPAAKPVQSLELGESEGPWMIMCTSFAGPTAEQQAHDLALELRQQFKLPAYTFRQTFDFTKPTEGLGYNKYGEPRKMRHLNGAKFQEIAVMVGNFSSVEDDELARTLEKIKHLHPQTLETKYQENSSQRFYGLRTIYRALAPDQARKQRGPMGAAFVTRNPLMPEEYFAAKGLDPFLVEINKDLPHNLLSNPGQYTVRVASFRGVDSLNKPAEFEAQIAKRKVAKIDEAAQKANDLCAALRAKGVEAYQFHDRTESIVTIGSFREVGQPRPDGKIEINPAVHRIMEEYGPVKTALPGNPSQSGMQLRTLAGIPFDPQPLPVQVPRQSVATAYNQTNSLYR